MSCKSLTSCSEQSSDMMNSTSKTLPILKAKRMQFDKADCLRYVMVLIGLVGGWLIMIDII